MVLSVVAVADDSTLTFAFLVVVVAVFGFDGLGDDDDPAVDGFNIIKLAVLPFHGGGSPRQGNFRRCILYHCNNLDCICCTSIGVK